MSQQCFILYRDDVATKGPLSLPRRPRRLRQEARVATGAWLRPRNFESRQEICCVAIGFDGVMSGHSNSMSRHS